MFILLAIILGLLIGILRKGKLSGITSKKSLWPLGLIGIILQIVLHLYYYSGGIAAIESFMPIINFLSYILILVVLVFNLDDFWTILLAVGMTSNFVVTFINGGHMPVSLAIVDSINNSAFLSSISEGTNAIYSVMDTSTTTLWFLGANIKIPLVGSVTSVYGAIPGFSVGGVLVFVGLIGAIQTRMAQAYVHNPFQPDTDFGSKEFILPEDNKQRLTPENSFQVSELDEDGGIFADRDRTLDNIFGSGSNDLFNDSNDNQANSDDVDGIESDVYESKETEDDDNREMTEYIPKLTPEMVREIRKRATREEIHTEQSQKESASITRVFTTLNNIGSVNSKEEKSSSDAPSQKEEYAGFFTKSFHAERHKATESHPSFIAENLKTPEEEPLVFDYTQPGLPVFFDEKTDKKTEEEIKEVKPVKTKEQPIIPLVEEIESKPVTQWEPVQRQTYSNTYPKKRVKNKNPYSTKYNLEDEEMSKKTMRSEEEMRNVWRQVAEEDQQRKRKKRSFEDSVNPFQLENERQTRIAEEKKMRRQHSSYQFETSVAQQPTQSTAQTKAMDRDTVARRWDNGTPVPVQHTQEPIAQKMPTAPVDREAINKEMVAKSQVTSSNVEKNATDLERERAGFEKVEIEIDGRTVSFWRKKKA